MITTLILATFAYAVLNLVIGFWKFRSDTFESFVSYRDRINTPLLVLTLNGSFIGGGMFFAVGQMGYEAGWAPFMLAAATTIGLVGLAIFAPTFRRLCDATGSKTIYDLIQTRLPDAKSFLKLYVVANLLLYFFLLASQFVVLATFLETFGNVSSRMALTTAIVTVGLNALVYSMVGGLKKDIWSDVFQMLTVGVGAAVIVVALAMREPIMLLSQAPPPRLTAEYGFLFWAGGLLFLSPAFLVRYDMWQRVLAAKNNRTAVSGCLLAIPVVVLAYLLFTGLGNAARGLVTESIDPRLATVEALRNLLTGPWFTVAALALYAAVIATADTFLNITSVSIERLFAPARTDERRRLGHLRVITLCVCMAAAALALFAHDVVDLLAGAFSSLVITMPALLYVIFSRRPARMPATSSLLLGFLTFVSLYVALPDFRKTAFVVGTVCALIALMVGILIRRVVGSTKPL